MGTNQQLRFEYNIWHVKLKRQTVVCNLIREHYFIFQEIDIVYLSDIPGPYNQVDTGTGIHWPDQHRNRRSDRVHWNTRLCLSNK